MSKHGHEPVLETIQPVIITDLNVYNKMKFVLKDDAQTKRLHRLLYWLHQKPEVDYDHNNWAITDKLKICSSSSKAESILITMSIECFGD